MLDSIKLLVIPTEPTTAASDSRGLINIFLVSSEYYVLNKTL